MDPLRITCNRKILTWMQLASSLKFCWASWFKSQPSQVAHIQSKHSRFFRTQSVRWKTAKTIRMISWQSCQIFKATMLRKLTQATGKHVCGLNKNSQLPSLSHLRWIASCCNLLKKKFLLNFWAARNQLDRKTLQQTQNPMKTARSIKAWALDKFAN